MSSVPRSAEPSAAHGRHRSPASVAGAARVAASVAFVLLAVTGCMPDGSGRPDVGAAPGHPGVVPTGVVVDYQLGGGYDPAGGVGGVVRDASDSPADDLWSACYVNGFQTQPGEADLWLDDHADLVLREDDGTPVTDPAWPDEMLLDLSTAEKRAGIVEVLGPVLRSCAAAGFDAVELDNLDSWTRSDGRLTEDDAVDLAARYVVVAHEAGLAVGQKNAAELGARGRDEAHFDFAVAEECQRWDECARYTDVYGPAVLDIEYADDLGADWGQVCADPQVPPSTILRDRDLTVPGDPAYVFDRC
ncbi:MAG TPA: endo alpha-1,4 polygalactosaminidase [Cellulomonas sp.]